ncbi:PPE family protein [Mycobacterium montefiorense]|uniref:PPE family protein PPE37 n=1 Tax=Mycobacterium montefiorense TaxID=154654 RepID=A0AA37PPR3_9MYCO|nr:PPE family protein [Mycobacterium montefiorense]GBG37580.1 putative PPE family protein PPE37 [Mycobacterium montefiorense]GKU36259.1 putative PPE family protein PPE37 [Mycobacterium montefiorense]GKU41247.1 putative PPE family protein PPE37 [Mycobacterium montefiorense]GKU47777.1 putative PPE family protein PPE37 [Mycobacterium montefiorense]GKU52768.1 putative PPE family protein PPE37 [Mycobacterium montefiorense]
MTYPIWGAFPPEIHSALLSTGAGPGGLIAAAEAWRTLAVQYTDTATELTAILATTQAAAWEGPTAAQFVAGHQSYVLWLDHTSAVATATATKYETMAAAYASALGAMPTPAELSGNHALHAALVATNFFGVNTIPIAVNEGDYSRMWVQAAAVMGVYQAVSQAILSGTPVTSAAPHIVTTEATSLAAHTHHRFPDPTTLILQALRKFLKYLDNLITHFLPGPLGALISHALEWVIAFTSTQAFLIPAYSILDSLIYFGPFVAALGLLAPIALIGLAGAAGLDNPMALADQPQTALPREGQQLSPVAAGVAHVSAGPAASNSAAPGSPTSSTATATGAVPATGAGEVLYAVGGDPGGEGFTPTFGGKAAANTTASLPDASAVAGSSEAGAKRRRTRLRQHGRKHQFAYLNEDLDVAPPDDSAEAQYVAGAGATPLGFAGTIPKATAAHARGLTHFAGGEFDKTPLHPMLPHTWDASEKP